MPAGVVACVSVSVCACVRDECVYVCVLAWCINNIARTYAVCTYVCGVHMISITM